MRYGATATLFFQARHQDYALGAEMLIVLTRYQTVGSMPFGPDTKSERMPRQDQTIYAP